MKKKFASQPTILTKATDSWPGKMKQMAHIIDPLAPVATFV